MSQTQELHEGKQYSREAVLKLLKTLGAANYEGQMRHRTHPYQGKKHVFKSLYVLPSDQRMKMNPLNEGDPGQANGAISSTAVSEGTGAAPVALSHSESCQEQGQEHILHSTHTSLQWFYMQFI